MADEPSAGEAGAGEPPAGGLTLLGAGGAAAPSRTLETFPNRHPGRRYLVSLECPEFTCVCPITGQPDFAAISIRYVPDQRVVESKSLKFYLWSYRNEGAFHEHVTNRILDDLVAALRPVACEVAGAFSVRGGISITVRASYERPDTGGWSELPPSAP